ncbi:multiheme c-type cytochrome [Blastopirellula marina]|uniref:Cytochrome c-552/4 domain-containing protein n=1 Tax=Blastopirellula marina TaxID=124 RepID=A0A2S8FAV4_9BACT|nr:multiheme c-type cytochrome [Blastopirellula marina]PQO29064.1 hypothetical protein C5Y98_22935 [Blastopirellula marina]PTL42335.1 hypothetical protein C5Y97_22945 [Blastopirellula marina]
MLLRRDTNSTRRATRLIQGRGAVWAGLAMAWMAGGGCFQNKSTSGLPLAIAVSGDTAGWIVPCGCTTNQSGGLLRRGTYLDQLRQEAEVLYLDVGGAIEGTAPYDVAKFEAIVQGELSMGLRLHNIGAAEAALGRAELHDLEKRLDSPIFFSANVQDADGNPLAPPSKTLEIAQQRVLVIGVLSASFATEKVQVAPPRTAILEQLKRSEVAGGHDFVLVLAYAPEEELRELARQLPELDAIVGGPTGQAIAPEQTGPVMLASATNKGKFLIELRLPTAAGKRLSGQAIELSEDFADASDQQENLETFYQKLAEADFAASQTSFVPKDSSTDGELAQMAGSASCRDCHPQDWQVWSDSAHAHAWQTLEKTGSQVDSYCQQCHVTGFGLSGGFVSAKRSPEQVNVGCESCHGPSQQHVKDPQIRTPYYKSASFTCVRCHDHENSPQFEYDSYWQMIEHSAKGAS